MWGKAAGRQDGKAAGDGTSPAFPPSRLAASLRRLFGMPDYPAYLDHLRLHHPERPLPTEREFFDEYLRARYGDGPTRCC